MPHKQDIPLEPLRLPGWEVLEVTGPDANTFLQAQLMNDLRTLQTGHWQWNGWLTPKGRVIAIFALLALNADRYWLVAPDVAAAELMQRLQRFVFRSKVTFRVRNDLGAFAQFDASPPHVATVQHADAAAQAADIAPSRIVQANSSESSADESHTGQETFWLDMGSSQGAESTATDTSQTRWLRLQSTSDSIIEDDAARRWRAVDIAHGLPRLSPAQSEQWTPQMLSLNRLNAYSLKKGCYPGQEIVARTHYLGQAKRELVRLTGNALTDGAEVKAEDHTLGTIVSCARDGALAVLAVERPPNGWDCGGEACHEMPLLDGLARSCG